MPCYALVKVGKHAQHGYVKVSLEDYAWLQELDRTLSNVGARGISYAGFTKWPTSGKTSKFHRFILSRMLNRDLVPGECVDHINGDTFDNRRENLRLASKAQNCRNSRRPRNNTSGYKGVTWNRKDGKFQATIRINGRQTYLGYFDTPQAAHLAYCKAATQHYGEFANFGTEVARGA